MSTADIERIMASLPLFEKVVEEYDISKVSPDCYGKELSCLRFLERNLIGAVSIYTEQAERIGNLITKVTVSRMLLETRVYAVNHSV